MLRLAFDTNGLRFLCEDAYLGRAARLKLRFLVRHRRARVIVGHGLLGELFGLYKPQRKRYFTQLRELEFLCGGRILVYPAEIVAREIRRRRRLTDREAFLSRFESRQIFENARIDAWILQRAANATTKKQEYGTRMAGARTDPFAPGARLELLKAFKGDRDATIDLECRSLMRAIYAKYDFTESEVSWDAPERAPAFRADVAYHIARDYLVTFEAKGPKSIDPNDGYDNAIFADAAYADVLVTSDRALRAIAKEAGSRTGVRLQQNEIWAREFLRR